VILTPDEIQAIRQEAGHFPCPSAAAIEALNIAQQGHGWISDELLKEVAELLGMSPADLDSVATFYNLIYRRPVGRRVIHYCDSVSCWVAGYEGLEAAIGAQLGIRRGETTADGRFTLLPIPCLGACEQAPALMVDEDLHTEVDEAALVRLLDGYE